MKHNTKTWKNSNGNIDAIANANANIDLAPSTPWPTGGPDRTTAKIGGGNVDL